MARTGSKLNFTLYLFYFVNGDVILIVIILKEVTKKSAVIISKKFFFSLPGFGSGEIPCAYCNLFYGSVRKGVGEFHNMLCEYYVPKRDFAE